MSFIPCQPDKSAIWIEDVWDEKYKKAYFIFYSTGVYGSEEAIGRESLVVEPDLLHGGLNAFQTLNIKN